MGLEDFERYSHDQMDNLRHLSLSVLESLSFEREALRWVVRGGLDCGGAQSMSVSLMWMMVCACRAALPRLSEVHVASGGGHFT